MKWHWFFFILGYHVPSHPQRFHIFGPRRHLGYSEQFLHQTKVSPFGSTLLAILFPPICAFLHLFMLNLNSIPINLGPCHFPGNFTFLLLLPHLMQQSLVVVAHHSVRCFLDSTFLSRRPTFLRRRLKFFTVQQHLQPSSENWLRTAMLRKPPLFSVQRCWPLSATSRFCPT